MSGFSMNLDSINWQGGIDMTWIAILVLFGIGIVAWALWWIIDYMSYKIKVIAKRQIGDPIIDAHGKKIFPVQTWETKAKLYNKKVGKGVTTEYFKMKGTSFDYQNYFPDTAFSVRRRSNLFDYMEKEITLLITQDRGPVPLLVSNPGYVADSVGINEVISAVTDSLKERDELYSDDFWNKYGAIMTLAILTGMLVIGMVFIIKYQQNSLEATTSQLQIILANNKEIARPEILAQ